MALFNLSARMDEVEMSMYCGDDCNILNGKNINEDLKDKDVIYFKDEDILQCSVDTNEEAEEGE